MKPLKATATTSQPVLTLQQIETIFYKIQDIYEIHKEFYDSLCPKVQQWDSNVTMGHLFQKLVCTFPGACSAWKRRRAGEMEHDAVGLGPTVWLSLHPATCSSVALGLVASLPAAAAAAHLSPPIPAASVPLAAAGMPAAGGSAVTGFWLELHGVALPWRWWEPRCVGDPLGRGRRLLPLCCLWVLRWWLPRVMLRVLPLLWTWDGSRRCARGCRGHAGEGRKRGQVEGCREAAVASASAVQALVTSPLDFGGLWGHRAGQEPHHPALGEGFLYGAKRVAPQLAMVW